MFIGQYEHTLDGKNRLSVPRKFREELEAAEERKGFYATRGLDECLFLYTESQWQAVVARLEEKSFTDVTVRKFQRLFYSNTIYVDIDASGRVLLPDNLKDVAGLKKNVTIVGLNGRIEVWDREKWRSSKEAAGGEYEALAQQLF